MLYLKKENKHTKKDYTAKSLESEDKSEVYFVHFEMLRNYFWD